jgi:hypothetical protein
MKDAPRDDLADSVVGGEVKRLDGDKPGPGPITGQ